MIGVMMVRSTRVRRNKRRKLAFWKKFFIVASVVLIMVLLLYETIIRNNFNAGKETITAEKEEIPQNLYTDDKFSSGDYSVKKNDDSINTASFSYVMNDKGSRPDASLSADELAKFNAVYIGKDGEKVIYLTFNVNTNTSNLESNLNILAKHNVKAIFFLTKTVIEENPIIVKRIINEGHLVGMTLSEDVDITQLAIDDPKKILGEISATEESFKNATGTEIGKFFRFTKGIFSKRALNYINQLGYKTVFWSYTTYDKDDISNKNRSLQLMKSYFHPGAIYSLNNSSVGTSEALDEYLTYMETQSYVFDLITKI
jgi:peptidoglycan-N-acetylmuramic acid deacetylase